MNNGCCLFITPTDTTDRGCKIQLLTVCSAITQRTPLLFFVFKFICAMTLLLHDFS